MFIKYHQSNKNSFGFRCITNAIVILLCFNISTVYALPQMSEVVSGSANFDVNGTNMRINASDNSIVNYNSFNIESNEAVNVTLPSAQAQMLNRVIGTDLSRLNGRLSSNGLFILVNTNGVLIGSQGYIDASKLILSTRDITNDNFLNKNYIFEKNSNGQLDHLLLNQGEINIMEGGFGVLIAGAVENDGKIVVPMGKAVLAGGDAVRLGLSNDGLVSVTIDKPTASTIYDYDGNPVTDQVSNNWEMQADGGAVILKAESITNIFEKAINLDGFVQADRVQNVDGVIKLVSKGKVDISGFVEASRVEIGDSKVSTHDAISIDNDFFNGLELVIATKKLKSDKNYKLIPYKRNANGYSYESEYSRQSESKTSAKGETIIHDRTWRIAGGYESERDIKSQSVVESNAKSDSVYTRNGNVYYDSTNISKGISAKKNSKNVKNISQFTGNGIKTSRQAKEHSVYKSSSVSLHLDNKNSKVQSVSTLDREGEYKSIQSSEIKTIFTKHGETKTKKSKILSLKNDQTVSTFQRGENANNKLIRTSDVNQKYGDIRKDTIKTTYSPKGKKIAKTIKIKRGLETDRTDSTIRNNSNHNYSRNVKKQKTNNFLRREVTYINDRAGGRQNVTNDVKEQTHIRENKQISAQVNDRIIMESEVNLDLKRASELKSKTQYSYKRFNTNMTPRRNPAKFAKQKQEPVLIRERIMKDYTESEREYNSSQLSKNSTVVNWERKGNYKNQEFIQNVASLSHSKYESSSTYKSKMNRQSQDSRLRNTWKRVQPTKNSRGRWVNEKKMVTQPIQVRNIESEHNQKSSTEVLNKSNSHTRTKSSIDYKNLGRSGYIIKQNLERDRDYSRSSKLNRSSSRLTKSKAEYFQLKSNDKKLNTEFDHTDRMNGLESPTAEVKQVELTSPKRVWKYASKSAYKSQRQTNHKSRSKYRSSRIIRIKAPQKRVVKVKAKTPAKAKPKKINKASVNKVSKVKSGSKAKSNQTINKKVESKGITRLTKAQISSKVKADKTVKKEVERKGNTVNTKKDIKVKTKALTKVNAKTQIKSGAKVNKTINYNKKAEVKKDSKIQSDKTVKNGVARKGDTVEIKKDVKLKVKALTKVKAKTQVKVETKIKNKASKKRTYKVKHEEVKKYNTVVNISSKTKLFKNNLKRPNHKRQHYLKKYGKKRDFHRGYKLSRR